MGDFKGWIQKAGSITLEELITDLGKDPRRGAITTFTGVTRADSDEHNQSVERIQIEAWEDKTSDSMQDIASRLGTKYDLLGLRIVHLEGDIGIGEPIVFIIISSAHRKEAFAALEDAIHAYKTESPVWKKEIYSDGSGKWITTAKD